MVVTCKRCHYIVMRLNQSMSGWLCEEKAGKELYEGSGFCVY